jgi:hypothetical protein
MNDTLGHVAINQNENLDSTDTEAIKTTIPQFSWGLRSFSQVVEGFEDTFYVPES